MDPPHPKSYKLPYNIIDKVIMGWTEGEEDKLVSGIQFLITRVPLNNGVGTYDKLVEELASYCTFTLDEKANVHILRWKLGHLTDMYRQFKKFIFCKAGVSYNSDANKVKIGSKYWRNIEEETELDAYFRIHGFRLYDDCCCIFEYYKLDQYASCIDENVHCNIPVGFKLSRPDVFHYLKHRVRYPHVKKSERNMRFRDTVWSKNDFNMYFFTGGWEPDDDRDFSTKLVEIVHEMRVDSVHEFEDMVKELSRRYDDPYDPQVTVDGIREKIRSLGYIYQLFKRFLFKTVGVEYNFHRCEARVTDIYLDRVGKEPQYMWFFRTHGDYINYEECFQVYDSMGLDKYANGDFPCIDPNVTDGVEVSYEDDVFKSYYQGD